jgi:Protein of unknown function (DUF2849)
MLNRLFGEKIYYLLAAKPYYIENCSTYFRPWSCPMTSPLDQKKIKIAGPVVVTANRVDDGAVVYRSPDGGWTTELGGAAIVIDADSARALAEAAAGDDLHAIGPYIAPVKLLPGGNVRPGNLRELIRRGGPTIELPLEP